MAHVIAKVDLEKLIREQLKGSGFDDQVGKTNTPSVKHCDCGRLVRNGSGWRMGDEVFCNRCGWSVVHELRDEPIVITKLYCGECSILFRAIQWKRGGRVRFCSERCSNTNRHRRYRRQ